MAGMPPSLIDRANEILLQLEAKQVDESGQEEKSNSLSKKIKRVSMPEMQLSIFDAHTETFQEIRRLLEGIDVNRLTPVEALLKLQEIKNKLK
jgi:DNA mismatch repair protein MutS